MPIDIFHIVYCCSAVVANAGAISFVTQLLDTKSTDRKMTLLHYIALIVKEKYPELANFYNELHFVDKAAAGEFAANIKLLIFWEAKQRYSMYKDMSGIFFVLLKSISCIKRKGL